MLLSSSQNIKLFQTSPLSATNVSFALFLYQKQYWLIKWILLPEYLKDKDEIERGYEEGDPNTPWETYTEKEESPLFNRNRKLLDKSELKKISKHPLWRNRDQARYPYDELNEKTQKIISSFEDKLIQVDDFKNIPQKPNYKRSETAQE